MRRSILITAAVLCLAGCGIYDRYERPALDVECPESITPLPWQALYTDPCLQALIDTALAQATDLQVPLKRIEEA